MTIEIINSWCNYYSCTLEVSSLVSLQFLFMFDFDFADKKINYVSNLFDENEELKSWQKILTHFQLTQRYYFKWFQLIHAIPRPWKLDVLNDKGNCKNIIYLNHHLSSFLFLINKILNCVLTVDYKMKQLITFL